MSKRSFCLTVTGGVIAALLICSVFLRPIIAQDAQPVPQPFRAGGITAVDVTGISDGRYVLTITGGAVSVVPLTLLAVGPVPPGPPVPPIPDTLSQRAREVRDMAKSINDPETGAKLTVLYQQLKIMVDNGQLKGQAQIGLMLSESQKMVIDSGKAKQWEPFTDKISDLYAILVEAGSSDASFSGLLGDMADGVEAAYPQKQIDPAFLELIMMILKMLLELFIKTSPAFAP